MLKMAHRVIRPAFAKGNQTKALEDRRMLRHGIDQLSVQTFRTGPIFALLRSHRTLPELRGSMLVHAPAKKILDIFNHPMAITTYAFRPCCASPRARRTNARMLSSSASAGTDS